MISCILKEDPSLRWDFLFDAKLDKQRRAFVRRSRSDDCLMLFIESSAQPLLSKSSCNSWHDAKFARHAIAWCRDSLSSIIACVLSVWRTFDITGRTPFSRTILILFSSLDARFDIAMAANRRLRVSVDTSALMRWLNAPELMIFTAFSLSDDKAAKARIDSRKTGMDFDIIE